jgi:eukaryotic-like serine/threonine-protein kinase
MTERSASARRPEPDLVGRLETLWRQGRRPALADFLAGAGSIAPASLLSILLFDQEQRWLVGEQPRAEDYLAAYPVLNDNPEHAIELIYSEFLTRERRGDAPTADDYAVRFPKHAMRLRQQIELHLAMPNEEPTSIGSDSDFDSQEKTCQLGLRPHVPDTARPTIPGYELLRELGRGGMGVVYEARDLKRDRSVALKMMQWSDPAALYRFKREFRALADLNHPNLVTLHELVGEGGQWFFTMELLAGSNFLGHVRGGALSGGPWRPDQESRLRKALAQLADGVCALHAAGKLHRDIKPGNVLVTQDGRVVLLDFGLAADLDRSGKYLSVHPGLLGTLDYMAPEQAAALPVSPASDWYAVGVMLYEALAGRPPHEGTPREILLAKQRHAPAAPTEWKPGLPDDLVALCMDLLRLDPAARPAAEEVSRRLRAGAALPAPEAQAAPTDALLVGRESHLAALGEAFARSSSGDAVVVSVHGRSGAGKSALLRSFLDDLLETAAAVVLEGRCYEQESVPYKALDSLIDALSSYLEGLPREATAALLPRDIQVLARVFPVLRRVEAVAEAPRRGAENVQPQEVRRRAHVALGELLGRIGDRNPLVLAIDDLQWGDMDSAAVLADLLAPPDPPALLLIGAYRREDIQANPALAAFAQLGKVVPWHEVAVDPLAPDELRDLLRALLGPGGELHADAIARQTGGYPFFVHEVVRFLQEGSTLWGPDAADFSLGTVLHARVQRLPAEAQKLLEIVAVAGRPIRLDTAFAAAEIGGEGPKALACLRAARLLRGSGQADRAEIETYHDRVRETVTGALAPNQLQLDHRKLAEAIQAAGGDAELLAMHWLGAGEPAHAGKFAAEAAKQAAEALAFDRASQLYRLALQQLQISGDEERTLRAKLGDALAGAGRGAEAAAEYLTAAAGAGPEEALDLQRRAAYQLLSGGHVDAGLAALRQVLQAVGLGLCSTPRRAFWALVWQRFLLRLRGLAYRQRTLSEIPAAELRKLDVCMSAAVGLSMVDTIQGAYFQSRSLLLALRAGESGRLVVALAIEGAHESISGTRSRKRTMALLQAAESLAQRDGRPYPQAMVQLAKGIAAALEGDWQGGSQWCDLADENLRATGTGAAWELGTAQRFALWPLMFMGEVAEIARRLPRLLKEARSHDDLYSETNLCLVIRTFVRLAADEPARARSELAETMGRWSQAGFHVQHMNRLLDEVSIDLYEGNGASAWNRLAEQWQTLVRSHLLRVQQVRIFVTHLRGRAALAASAQARHPESLWTAAGHEVKVLEREGAPWAIALARLLQAGLAVPSGNNETAAAAFRDAAAHCEKAAMHLFAAAARRQHGVLLGGDEGKQLMQQADAWMAAQQVKHPERMAAFLVPLPLPRPSR